MPATHDPLSLITEFLREESGGPFIEYVLIGSLIAVVGGLFFMVLNKTN